MPFVIQRNEDGAFVRPGGHETSYTHKLQEAEVYRTREEAERNRCPGNEHVTDLESVLTWNR
jgi:hypothetical protein